MLTKRPRRLIGTKRRGIEKIESRGGMEVEEKGEVGEGKEGHKSAQSVRFSFFIFLS